MPRAEVKRDDHTHSQQLPTPYPVRRTRPSLPITEGVTIPLRAPETPDTDNDVEDDKSPALRAHDVPPDGGEMTFRRT